MSGVGGRVFGDLVRSSDEVDSSGSSKVPVSLDDGRSWVGFGKGEYVSRGPNAVLIEYAVRCRQS